jgi:hypothetical protein
MMNLDTTIDELRKAIASDEKVLNNRKEGLALLEKASGKLAKSPVVSSRPKKYKPRSPKVSETVVAPAEDKIAEIPAKNRPRPSWTAERRAKTEAALKKARATKKKAAK